MDLKVVLEAIVLQSSQGPADHGFPAESKQNLSTVAVALFVKTIGLAGHGSLLIGSNPQYQ
ncbi:MAG: hypothetical protein Q7S36_01305, partial [Candidatus Liptonbacteria bacterium]|nr:hypothetical protein [Candidatus Liptonbacteria bacterium]